MLGVTLDEHYDDVSWAAVLTARNCPKPLWHRLDGCVSDPVLVIVWRDDW
jgi:hypothetical protein